MRENNDLKILYSRSQVVTWKRGKSKFNHVYIYPTWCYPKNPLWTKDTNFAFSCMNQEIPFIYIVERVSNINGTSVYKNTFFIISRPENVLSQRICLSNYQVSVLTPWRSLRLMIFKSQLWTIRQRFVARIFTKISKIS